MILSCVLVFVLILKYIPNILQKLKDWDWPKKYDFGFKYNRHICTSEHAVFWCVPTPMYFLAVIQLYFPTLSLCTAQITLLQFVPIPMVYICSVEWHENCATWQEKYVLVFQARKWKSKLLYLDCFQNSPGGRKRGKKRQFTLYLQTNFYQETWNYFRNWNERITHMPFYHCHKPVLLSR